MDKLCLRRGGYRLGACMKLRLIFNADVADSDDIKGVREQIGMCFEALGDARLVSVAVITGTSKVERGTYGRVMLSDAGYDELCRMFGKGKAEALINELSWKLHQKHYRFEDHFSLLVKWERERERAGGSGNGVRAQSFDVDEFFNAAVRNEL